MKALVTGSSGYIGQCLTKLISDTYADNFIIGCDHSRLTNKQLTIQGYFDAGDSRLAQYVKSYEADTVFHLAAAASVPDSVTRPFHYYYNNVGETSKLLNNLVNEGWSGKFIFASSAGVYGIKETKMEEHDLTLPPHPYGHSKLLTEQLLEGASKFTRKIKYGAFRFFNVVGTIDEYGDHLDSSHVLQRICHAAITDTPFTVNGTDFNTEDGTCVRDYVHVKDICRAHLHLANYLDTVEPGFYSVYNLGTSTGCSVRELTNKFKEVTGVNLKVEDGPPRAGDPGTLVASPDKFIQETDFKYEHSDIESIILDSWNYYKQKWEDKNNGI